MSKLRHNRTKTLFLYLPIALIYYIIVIHTGVVAHAQSDVYLAVRAGGSGLLTIGIEGFESSGHPEDFRMVKTTLADDLERSGLFMPVVSADSLADARGDLLSLWKKSGAKYLLIGEESGSSQNVSVNLIDMSTTLTVFKEEYRIEPQRGWRTAHVIADDLIEHFTGLRGGFSTRIAFVRAMKGGDEVFLMDADGRNVRQLTFTKTIIMSPSWSPDGSSIAYSALSSGNWLIMVTNITTGQSIDITPWQGLNTTPSWSPVEAGVLAFSSSRDGNAEVYTSRVNGKDIRRLTNHRRIDHSPAWSPDGSRMAFVSDRTGNPLIYLMNSDGSDQHRLTATPNAYEDSPAWSPQGDRIAFVLMSDYGFDIATCSPSGDDVVVLTFAQGSNEGPKWSPDGLRIIFSSTRGTGTKRIFIMNRDGSNVRPLTIDGNSYSPAWAPPSNGNDIRISSKR